MGLLVAVFPKVRSVVPILNLLALDPEIVHLRTLDAQLIWSRKDPAAPIIVERDPRVLDFYSFCLANHERDYGRKTASYTGLLVDG